MYKRFPAAVVCVLMLSSALFAGEIRLQCVKDNWISAYGTVGMGGGDPEVDFSMGKTRVAKLKTIQEAGIFAFDAAPVKGRKIEKAALYLHEEKVSNLRWMGVSTIASDWVEGNGANEYELDKTGFGATFNEASYTKTPWSYPGSRLTDVTMTGGYTLDWHGECKRAPGGWLVLEIDPKLVASLAVKDSYGLFVQDDGLGVGYNWKVHQREAGPGAAPYISVTLGAADGEPPGAVNDLKLAPAPEASTLTGGAVALTFTAPKDAFCYFITVNGKPLERWRTPRPVKEGTAQRIVIDELPSEAVSVSLSVCDDAGNMSGPFNASGVASAALPVPQPLPEVNLAALFSGKPARPGEPPVRNGLLRVWALPEVEEVSPVDGKLLHSSDPTAYMKQNCAWDGAAGRIRIAGIRNEIVAFQLVLEAVAGKLDGIQVSLTDLAGPDAPIAASNFSLYREWYIKAGASWQPEVAIPLAPGEALTIPAPDNRVDGQRVQALYCDLRVPKSASPGTYKGEVRVTARGVDAFALPLELTVYPAVMPDELSFLPELNAYSEPGGAGSQYWFACHRLAHSHRSVLNVVAYSQNGSVHEYVPPVTGSGAAARIADWSKFDSVMGPLLDGSAFDDGVPLPVLYLPLHENWPAPVDSLNYAGKKRGKGALEEFFQKAPALDQLFPQAYKEAFSAVAADFARHFAQKGWLKTEFQCYLNNKPNYREEGNGTAWWTLDEPYHYKDWEALKAYGEWFKKGIAGLANEPGKPKMIYRSDISRPQFTRNILKGVLDVIYVGGAFFDRWICVNNMAKEYPLSPRAYGSCNAVERSSIESQAWCVKSFIYGGDGVLPWQTIEGPGALRAPEDTAVLIDGRQDFPRAGGPVASLRLKALRRGEQDVEYLYLLMRSKGYTREQVRDLVLKRLDLGAEFKQKFADEAAAVTFSGLAQADFAAIREAIAQVVGGGPAEARAAKPGQAASTATIPKAPASMVFAPDTAGASAFLKKGLIDVVAGGADVRATIEFGGMPMKGRVTAADADGIKALVAGNEMTVAWSEMRPVRFYELASRALGDTVEVRLKLAHYCLGNGLIDEAMRELDAALAKGAPKETVEGLRAFATREK